MTQKSMRGQIYLENVRLYRDAQLGGMVCKAEVGGLTCAAKSLLPFSLLPKSVSNQKQDSSSINKFEREYSLLSALKHPHLVQYLGLHNDPDSGIVFLVMELVDTSLTHYLERSEQQLPYHTQVNLCHDISLAVAYLHSNSTIHCELSSNNVLVTAGSRAKVSDFGMRRLADAIPSCSLLAHNSAKSAYLPPEALHTPSLLSKETDCYSIGVLAIQIVTRQPPNPGPAVLIVKDPRYPTGKVQAIVPEMERRKASIESIDSRHPLKSLACSCLGYEANSRPSAKRLCQSLNSLKESAQYAQSLKKRTEQPTSSRTVILRGQTHQQQQQLGKLQQDNKAKRDQIEGLQQQIAAKDEEIRQVRMQLEMELREHRQAEQRQSTEQSGSSGSIMRASQTWRLLRSSTKRKSSETSAAALPKKARHFHIDWKHCNDPPEETMYRGTCATDGVTVYCNSSGSSKVHAYNLEKDSWWMLPECSSTDFGLAVIEGLLTTVGGQLGRRLLNSLTSFYKQSKTWQECFPAMPTKRSHPSVLYKDKILVVAGGQIYQGSSYRNDLSLRTVELLDLKTDLKQWCTASSLPYAVTHMSAAICGEDIYLVGGCDSIGRSTLSAYTCSLPQLVASCTGGRSVCSTEVWHPIADSPLHLTTCVNLGSRLVAVGGRNPKKRANYFVYIYDKEDDSWSEIGDVPLARYKCLLVGLPEDHLMLVGGLSKSGYLCDAFIGSSS